MKHKLNAKETLFNVYPELFNNCGKQLMYYKVIVKAVNLVTESVIDCQEYVKNSRVML